eukprot:1160540-Pelagomonas_calceolata.AAC.8
MHWVPLKAAPMSFLMCAHLKIACVLLPREHVKGHALGALVGGIYEGVRPGEHIARLGHAPSAAQPCSIQLRVSSTKQ